MRHRSVIGAVLVLASSATVHADSLVAEATLASDYLFDGVSQTQNGPALQASLAFEDDSGLYVSAWASNIDFGEATPADAELDLQLGVRREFAGGWEGTTGVARYVFVGGARELDFAEWFVGGRAPTGTALQIWWADDDALGGEAVRGKATQSVALAEALSLEFELSRSVFPEGGPDDFTHWQVGVARSFGEVEAYVGWSDTDLPPGALVADGGSSLADGRVLVMLSTSIDLLAR